MVGACVVWNLAGARAVGDGSILLGLLLLAPFLILLLNAEERTEYRYWALGCHGCLRARQPPEGLGDRGSDQPLQAGEGVKALSSASIDCRVLTGTIKLLLSAFLA